MDQMNIKQLSAELREEVTYDLNHETKALLLKVARMIQVEIEHRNAPQAQPSQYGSEEMQSLILAKLTAPQPAQGDFQEWWNTVADDYEVADFKKMRRAWYAALQSAQQ